MANVLALGNISLLPFSSIISFTLTVFPLLNFASSSLNEVISLIVFKIKVDEFSFSISYKISFNLIISKTSIKGTRSFVLNIFNSVTGI